MRRPPEPRMRTLRMYLFFITFSQIYQRARPYRSARGCFGMKLNREERFSFMGYAFNAVVIEIFKGDAPLFGKSLLSDRVSMILAGDEAVARFDLLAGLVLPAVAIGKLVGGGPEARASVGFLGRCRILACSRPALFSRIAMVLLQVVGSPRPLERKIPSYSSSV